MLNIFIDQFSVSWLHPEHSSKHSESSSKHLEPAAGRPLDPSGKHSPAVPTPGVVFSPAYAGRRTQVWGYQKHGKIKGMGEKGELGGGEGWAHETKG